MLFRRKKESNTATYIDEFLLADSRTVRIQLGQHGGIGLEKVSQMVPQLRERFVAEQNARTLRECLDGHSRSSMASFMHLMRAAGMLKKENFADCSEELQKQIFFER